MPTNEQKRGYIARPGPRFANRSTQPDGRNCGLVRREHHNSRQRSSERYFSSACRSDQPRPATEPEPEKPTPPVSIKKSIADDFLISMGDGKKYKSLKRHLSGRGLTPSSTARSGDCPRTILWLLLPIPPTFGARQGPRPRAEKGRGSHRRSCSEEPVQAESGGSGRSCVAGILTGWGRPSRSSHLQSGVGT